MAEAISKLARSQTHLTINTQNIHTAITAIANIYIYIYTLRDEERHPYLRENTPEQSPLWWRGGGVCLLTICPPGLTNCGRLRSAFSYRRHMRKTHYHNALKQIVAQQCVYVVYTLCSVYDATSQKKRVVHMSTCCGKMIDALFHISQYDINQVIYKP